jgi:hypothetical protein
VTKLIEIGQHSNEHRIPSLERDTPATKHLDLLLSEFKELKKEAVEMFWPEHILPKVTLTASSGLIHSEL